MVVLHLAVPNIASFLKFTDCQRYSLEENLYIIPQKWRFCLPCRNVAYLDVPRFANFLADSVAINLRRSTPLHLYEGPKHVE